MTKPLPTWIRSASVFALLLAISATGCKSSGNSRWAWNPWSKSSADATALAESTPKLPTADDKPQIEELAKEAPKTSSSSATLAQGATPPALKGMDKTIGAYSKALPSVDKEAKSATMAAAPAWKPYPTSPSAKPDTTKPPSSAVASTGGPYDPNGYQPPAPAAPKATTPSTDRYGLGSRYASSDSSNFAAPFGDLPPLDDAASAIGDRYATATNAATKQVASAVENRFDTATAQAKKSVDSMADQTSQFANTTLDAVAPPASAAYPSTSSTASTPAKAAYPVASAKSPGSSPYPTTPEEKSTVGNLPAPGSVYAATTPITPIEPTSAAEPTTESRDSVVRLTTLPGEYRPGGTGTYQSTSTSSEATKRY